MNIRVGTWLVLVIAAITNTAEAGEYCQWEQFVAECLKDEVVIIEHAIYGIMQYSRCIKKDYGFVGCSNDVRDIADSICSGRHKCTIDIPNRLFEVPSRLFDGIKQCPEDLKSYLEANYTCLKVQKPQERCVSEHRIPLPLPSGYLASTISGQTGCGTVNSPWLLNGQIGQQFIIKLTDFMPSLAVDNEISSIHDFADKTMVSCRVYATIREPLLQQHKTVCSSPGARNKLIYKSRGHEVEIRIITTAASDIDRSFLLHYTAIGCSEETAPKPLNGWWRRRDDEIEGGCLADKIAWRLKCNGTAWIGSVTNCTAVAGAGSGASIQTGSILALHHVPSLITILCLAVPISLIVLAIGMLMVYKRQMKQKSRKAASGGCYSHKQQQQNTIPRHFDGYYDSVPPPPLYNSFTMPPYSRHYSYSTAHKETDQENHYAYIDELRHDFPYTYTLPRSSDVAVHGETGNSRKAETLRVSKKRSKRAVPASALLPPATTSLVPSARCDEPEDRNNQQCVTNINQSELRQERSSYERCLQRRQDNNGVPDNFVLDSNTNRKIEIQNR